MPRRGWKTAPGSLPPIRIFIFLSQVVAGRAGIEAGLQPPPSDDTPYAAERPALPKSLPEALDLLDKEPLFRRELGDTFIDYFIKLKRTEAGRYLSSLGEDGASSRELMSRVSGSRTSTSISSELAVATGMNPGVTE